MVLRFGVYLVPAEYSPAFDLLLLEMESNHPLAKTQNACPSCLLEYQTLCTLGPSYGAHDWHIVSFLVKIPASQDGSR